MYVLTAALGALVWNLGDVSTVVALHFSLAFVMRHRHRAVLALECLSASAAEHDRRVSAPVEQYHDLFFFLQPLANLFREFARDHLLLPSLLKLQPHIENFDFRQRPLFHAINCGLPITDVGSVTARGSVIATYLCPSSTPDGPVRVTGDERQTVVLVADLAASQYIASAGQGEVEELPGSNNGIFFRNSCVAFRDVTDGLSQTLLVGERSRNLADATWVGAVASGHVCTNPGCGSSAARFDAVAACWLTVVTIPRSA